MENWKKEKVAKYYTILYVADVKPLLQEHFNIEHSQSEWCISDSHTYADGITAPN